MANTVFFREASKEHSTIGWKDIFSESFKKHSKQEREYAMQVGTVARTVPESRMLSSWHKPWLWWPTAKAGIGLVLVLYAAYFVPGMLGFPVVVSITEMCTIIPPLVIPLVMMIFFWELNVPQNISVGDMAVFYLAGGIISFCVTGIMFAFVPSEPASLAAFREEPGKLAASVLILLYIQKVQKKKIYGLTGLTVGAIVGAAFSGLESASYALRYLGNMDAVRTVQMLRGVTEIAGHIFYCVPYSCAIALHAQNGKLGRGSFLNMQTLLALAVSMGMHFTWNSGLGGIVMEIAQCCLAPVILIYWVRQCLRQIVQICGPKRSSGAAAGAYAVTLMCKTTALQGMCWKGGQADGPLVIGRSKDSCQICFPADTAGVSREHCRVFLGQEGWMLQDLGSTYGTYVDGRRLGAQECAPIHPGSEIYLGSKKVWISVL